MVTCSVKRQLLVTRYRRRKINAATFDGAWLVWKLHVVDDSCDYADVDFL